jgi:hypothetical protein
LLHVRIVGGSIVIGWNIVADDSERPDPVALGAIVVGVDDDLDVRN